MRSKPVKRNGKYYETLTCPECGQVRTVLYYSARKTEYCAFCYRKLKIKKEHDLWSKGLFRDITK